MSIRFSTTSVSIAPEHVITAGLPTELVRGEERQFLDLLLPLVRRGPVALDFAHVVRIDAAGIAALITLYSDACKARTRFTITNPSARVREILALVGLDGFLLARDAVDATPCRTGRVPSAA